MALYWICFLHLCPEPHQLLSLKDRKIAGGGDWRCCPCTRAWRGWSRASWKRPSRSHPPPPPPSGRRRLGIILIIECCPVNYICIYMYNRFNRVIECISSLPPTPLNSIVEAVENVLFLENAIWEHSICSIFIRTKLKFENLHFLLRRTLVQSGAATVMILCMYFQEVATGVSCTYLPGPTGRYSSAYQPKVTSKKTLSKPTTRGGDWLSYIRISWIKPFYLHQKVVHPDLTEEVFSE